MVAKQPTKQLTKLDLIQPIVILLVIFGIAYFFSAPPSTGSDVKRLESTLYNLISYSCSDCRTTEIVWNYTPSSLSAEYHRRSGTNCPVVIAHQDFFALGQDRSISADTREGFRALLPGEAVRSCRIVWYVQLGNS